ncbi:protein tyrosine phosphatase [Thermoplasmatales archaeon SCGC AB-539-N05]|nr:protein tyrosine phosphatase [Thermoplasmatales archaeon SCGC AB-539-N05]
MAEGFLKAFFKDKYESFSAGVQPTSVNPYSVEVMKEIGIDISGQYSKSVEEYKDTKFDYVVTVCDNVKEKCPFYNGRKMIHINFEDPSELDGDIVDILYEFRKLRDEIKRFVKETF